MAPAQGLALLPVGEVIRAGRRLTVSQTQVSALDAAGEVRLCAVSMVTMMALRRVMLTLPLWRLTPWPNGMAAACCGGRLLSAPPSK
jgi:hypothetical protein